jgi:prepilin-type N-terminal cleavage/methylation domain-containing protein
MTNIRKQGFTLVELLVVIAIIGVIVALLMPALQRAREASRRSSCLNNIRQIALATIEYETTHRRMPGLYQTLDVSKLTDESVTLATTWAVTILPGMQRERVYAVHAMGRLPNVFVPSYVCPTDSTVTNSGPELSYVANAGRAGSAASQTSANGAFINHVFRPELTIREQHWYDGRDRTLLYSENVDAGHYDEIGWNIWGMLLTDIAAHNEGRDRMWGLGFFWWPDPPHSTWAPINSIGKDRSAITCRPIDGYPHLTKWSDSCNADCCESGGDDMQRLSRPSSMHGGGVNVAFASGRAMFLRENIENKVYIALMTLEERRSDNPHRDYVLQAADYR